MSSALHQLNSEFFKTLGHPARLRILELLAEDERSVGEIQPEVGLESSHLSQQLGVLRRAGVVLSRRSGSSVIYSLATPRIAELLVMARAVMADLLDQQVDVLHDLRGHRRVSHRNVG
jgi:ArsR family transcriptional regulator